MLGRAAGPSHLIDRTQVTAAILDGMWRNWAGNQNMTPAAVLRPRDNDELASAVKTAAASGQRVKAIGSGHSFTGIGLTDGLLLQLDQLVGLTHVNRERCQVTVLAGTPLHTLNALLATHGLGLTNMGDIDRQTLTGALATGTHGTGRDSGGPATQVVGLDMVLADGSLLTCSREENSEVFGAARVSLGALGVLTSLTLQVEPAFLLEAIEQPMPLDQVLAELDELTARNEHFEFYWFPHTDIALTKSNNRTQVAAPLSRGRALLDDEILSNGLFGLTCRVGRAVPQTVPLLNKVAAKTLSARRYSDAAPRVFTSARRVRFREMEYAVPREHVVDVLRELRTLPDRLRLQIGFPVEVRVAPPDDIALSTASGRDTAYIAVHLFQGVDTTRWFGAVESLMGAVQGRPHWGKLHTLGAAELSGRYPRFAEFTSLRDTLDPQRVFGNAYLERVLG